MGKSVSVHNFYRICECLNRSQNSLSEIYKISDTYKFFQRLFLKLQPCLILSGVMVDTFAISSAQVITYSTPDADTNKIIPIAKESPKATKSLLEEEESKSTSPTLNISPKTPCHIQSTQREEVRNVQFKEITKCEDGTFQLVALEYALAYIYIYMYIVRKRREGTQRRWKGACGVIFDSLSMLAWA